MIARPVRMSSSLIVQRRHDVQPVEVGERPQAALPCTPRPPRPSARRRRPAALNGTSGSRVGGRGTSSIAQNTPRPRTSPTTGGASAMLAQRRADDVVAEVAGVLDDALLLEDVDAGDGGGAGQRVAGVGEPAGERPLGERVGDRAADDHAAERHVAGVDALGEADQVGRDAPAVDGEPLAAAAEAGHHLVADHHDAVPSHSSRTPAGSRRAGTRMPLVPTTGLEHDRGDVSRALDHDHVGEVLRAPARTPRRRRRRGTPSGTGTAPRTARRRACPARWPSGAGRRSS